MTDQSEDPVGARVDPSQPFSIAIEPQPDVVRIAPRGELDLATADQFQREIGQLVDAGFMRIVIDLRGVVFLDSTALHVLIAAHARAQQDNWELAIIPAPRAVHRVFEITGANDRLPFTTANGHGVTVSSPSGGPSPPFSVTAAAPDIARLPLEEQPSAF
jgi:anti-sigma B factor antagonist